MQIGRIEKPGNDDFCYVPQNPFPTFIYVKRLDKSLEGAVYQLASTVRRRKEPPRGGLSVQETS
jgi:hypothetical protein